MDTAWYNENANRSYPFIDDIAVEGGFLANNIFLDAGIVFGPESEFVPGGNTTRLGRIYLDVYSGGGAKIKMYFYSDETAETILYGEKEGQWDAGEIVELVGVTVDEITGEPSDTLPQKGLGFVVLGSSDDLRQAALGDEWEDVDAEIEPALVQSLYDSYVQSVDLYATGGLNWFHVATAVATGIVGDIALADGFNMRIYIDEPANTVTITAALGAGEGPPQEWSFPAGTLSARDAVYSFGPALPNESGVIQINGSGGIQVSTLGSVVTLSLNADSNPFCQDQSP
jgi:hypothetical protein